MRRKLEQKSFLVLLPSLVVDVSGVEVWHDGVIGDLSRWFERLEDGDQPLVERRVREPEHRAHEEVEEVLIFVEYILKNGPIPASFSVYFQSFQTNIITIFTTNIREKCPSTSIWCQDSNPQLLNVIVLP